jgi:UDP-N-acetylmuramate--alanine ligase
MDHPRARHIGGLRQAADFLLKHLLPGDVLLTLGAGDGDKVGKWVLEAFQATEKDGFYVKPTTAD